ncbi:helix-turn-helix domain-containing protein [Oryzifoliimicrobium ureilyticus]|uniref:helix-turn-helix domain-containing protein n=1 Tax=Oryzifoliimicrobium ureilyticus TaxID=3113724 RepID=UPI00307668A7
MSISLTNLDEAKSGAAPINIASAVKTAREAAGYTIEDLSVTCGLVAAEIAAIENGADNDPAKLRRIASALQVPASDFMV